MLCHFEIEVGDDLYFQIVSEASKTILKDSTTSNQIDNWHLTPLMTAAESQTSRAPSSTPKTSSKNLREVVEQWDAVVERLALLTSHPPQHLLFLGAASGAIVWFETARSRAFARRETN